MKCVGIAQRRPPRVWLPRGFWLTLFRQKRKKKFTTGQFITLTTTGWSNKGVYDRLGLHRLLYILYMYTRLYYHYYTHVLYIQSVHNNMDITTVYREIWKIAKKYFIGKLRLMSHVVNNYFIPSNNLTKILIVYIILHIIYDEKQLSYHWMKSYKKIIVTIHIFYKCLTYCIFQFDFNAIRKYNYERVFILLLI